MAKVKITRDSINVSVRVGKDAHAAWARIAERLGEEKRGALESVMLTVDLLQQSGRFPKTRRDLLALDKSAAR